jgi:hypothetical protein
LEIEKLVKMERRKYLYMAVFVRGNHEVAVYVDFSQKTFRWGKRAISLCGAQC